MDDTTKCISVMCQEPCDTKLSADLLKEDFENYYKLFCVCVCVA